MLTHVAATILSKEKISANLTMDTAGHYRCPVAHNDTGFDLGLTCWSMILMEWSDFLLCDNRG